MPKWIGEQDVFRTKSIGADIDIAVTNRRWGKSLERSVQILTGKTLNLLLDEGTQVVVAIEVGLVAECQLDPKYFIVVNSGARQV